MKIQCDNDRKLKTFNTKASVFREPTTAVTVPTFFQCKSLEMLMEMKKKTLKKLSN